MPIVFVSALPRAALAVRLAGCPYDAIIAKPFDLDLVAETVRRFLQEPVA
jgi:DNA-binding response OmpR family regulator